MRSGLRTSAASPSSGGLPSDGCWGAQLAWDALPGTGAGDANLRWDPCKHGRTLG